MRNIFLSKKLAYVIVALALVVLLLVFILMTQLSQMASLNDRVEHLKSLIEYKDNEIQQTTELLEYLESNEYIMQWAIEHNLLPEGADSWIKK